MKKAREHDERLSRWGVPLFADDAKLAPTLDAILRGRGIRDDADDTIRWVAIFRQEWSKAEGQTPITKADLDKAEREATELLRLLDAAEGEDTAGSPRDLRQRASTRWATTYQEILDLDRYLLRHDPAAAARLPAIAAERGGATSAEGGQVAPAQPTEPASPAAPVTPDKPA